MSAIAIILFLSVALPAVWVYQKGPVEAKKLNNWLIFAGSYIFSISIIHIMPELLLASDNPHFLSIFFLVGFFMQIGLDTLTSGTEHGHYHGGHEHFSKQGMWLLVLGMCIHGLMDGGILVHNYVPEAQSISQHSLGLLAGVVVHKIPAALILSTLLLHQFKNKTWVFLCLLLFALSSPLGFYLSHMASYSDLVNSEMFNILFAIVTGNFLHISTTIYFENNPEHRFQKKKSFI
jgi:zinc transporter ZupT